MRTRKFTLGACGLAALAAVCLVASIPSSARAQADPTLGTWVLNLAKSKYDPGLAPQSLTVVRTSAGTGVKISSTGVGADGKPTAVSYTVTYDGTDYPVTGSANYDAVSIKKTGASTLEADRKKGGKSVGIFKYSVSKDGKTMTVRGTGTDAKGEKHASVSVFDKK